MPQIQSLTPRPSKSHHLKLTLSDAHSTYQDRNPACHQAYLSSCKYLPGGNTRTVLHAEPFPMTFATGKGCSLTSLDGHTYTDFLGEYTAGIYGHNHPTIRAAVDEALDRGWSLGGNNEYEKELGRLVCQRFSPTMELVRFTNSGTEASMMAVATAIAWTGRKKILVFGKGYHGATLSFRSASASHEADNAKSVNLPHEWVLGTYNDVGKTETMLSAIPPESLAAILVEPMLGSGGAVPGPLPFLRFLRSYASSHGALLIFDEVMTSRLTYRGLGHKVGIQPDLMTVGKWVGGGMSFGAFGGRREVMAMFDPRNGILAHAGTFNNNVLSMAAGCAGCALLNEEKIDQLNELGERMKAMVQDVIADRLAVDALSSNAVANGHSSEHERSHLSNQTPTTSIQHRPSTPQQSKMYISGIGSILAIHFAPSPLQTTLQSLFYHHMLSENICLAERGFIALNIELGLEHVEAFVAATGRFLDRYKTEILGAEEA